MIRYSLRCKEGHEFDGWFRSSEGFDTLRAAGLVACAICGTGEVEKSLMAPAVAPEREKRLTIPNSPAEKALSELRKRVETNSDYVGLSFAAEARAMHEGRAPERPIHGEAKPDEARKLLEDGVPVLPLPFLPKSRTN